MSGNSDKLLLDQQVLDTLYDAIGASCVGIIDLFISDFAKSMAQLKAAINNADYVTAARIAHSLKASCANLGAMQLAALAIALEQTINLRQATGEQLIAMLAVMEQNFAAVQPLLLAYKMTK